MTKRLSVLVLLFSMIASAQAVEVNFLGGLNTTSIALTNSPGVSISGKSKLSYGATVGFGFAPKLGIETGFVMVGKKAEITTTAAPGTILTRDGDAWEVPLLVRIKPLSFFDIGVGGYFQRLTSKVDETTCVSGACTTVSRKWADIDTASLDYGLKASLRLKIPFTPLFRFIADISYNLGMRDLDLDTTDTVTVKNRDMNILAGVSIGF